jgi:hypothetical protein
MQYSETKRIGYLSKICSDYDFELIQNRCCSYYKVDSSNEIKAISAERIEVKGFANAHEPTKNEMILLKKLVSLNVIGAKSITLDDFPKYQNQTLNRRRVHLHP